MCLIHGHEKQQNQKELLKQYKFNKITYPDPNIAIKEEDAVWERESGGWKLVEVEIRFIRNEILTKLHMRKWKLNLFRMYHIHCHQRVDLLNKYQTILSGLHACIDYKAVTPDIFYPESCSSETIISSSLSPDISSGNNTHAIHCIYIYLHWLSDTSTFMMLYFLKMIRRKREITISETSPRV